MKILTNLTHAIGASAVLQWFPGATTRNSLVEVMFLGVQSYEWSPTSGGGKLEGDISPKISLVPKMKVKMTLW